MTDKQLIKYLALTNNKYYTLSKTVEELNELSTILLQYLNKPRKRKLYMDNINKEMADVQIRLNILKQFFKNSSHVKSAARTKLERYKEYVRSKKYIGKT